MTAKSLSLGALLLVLSQISFSQPYPGPKPMPSSPYNPGPMNPGKGGYVPQPQLATQLETATQSYRVIHRAYHGNSWDWIFTANSDMLIPLGYQITASPFMVSGARSQIHPVALTRCVNTANRYHRISVQDCREKDCGSPYAIGTPEYVLGYISQFPRPGMVPLYKFRQVTNPHFPAEIITIDPAAESLTGWLQIDGVLGYVYPTGNL